ncbi:DUF3168 domain-containing protein [Variovorax sp. JS1663]|uniref:DUF3168 domain-containing protein n=1 Tax=Variovorax sp. JS1663 TaxID=1851577 RepID=UPI000B346B06|nr:DUF3168 domain-containing protein [Variovorax sp. JS1663]
MTVPALITALSPLFTGGAWPLRADQGTPMPYLTLQRAGGQPVNTFCGVPGKENGRFQFNVWAKTQIEADALMAQVKAVVCDQATFRGVALSEREWVEGYDTRTFGARQDFSIWWATT